MRKNKLFYVVVLLTILLCVMGYLLYSNKEKMKNIRINEYSKNFSNLVNFVNSAENYLAKAMISKSSRQACENLTQIWRDSDLAMLSLSQIPLNNVDTGQTEKFLNQLSDYSYSLSRKSMSGNELEKEDFENLDLLYDYCSDLENTLNQLSDDIFSGDISWEEINIENSKRFAQAVDNINFYNNIDENLNKYEGLIYDGAYSDHVSKQEKYGLGNDYVDENRAFEIAKEFLNEYQIDNFHLNQDLDNADIPSYDFAGKIGKNSINIMISKQGGKVVQVSYDRDIGEEKINVEEAKELGKNFLDKKGFPNMKDTYYIKYDKVLTINYAYEDDGIIVYPDLIKVKVALDTGEILGIETIGYLNSHRDRNYEKDKFISIEEARTKINDKVEIKAEDIAVIPTDWKSEIVCYEFKGKVKNKDFLMYVNAYTGEEEKILVILETPGGTLTT